MKNPGSPPPVATSVPAGGVWGPFFGHPCSTTPAPAVMAPRYRCPLFTADIHRAFEAAIRRDPANWFWVHDRWKQRRSARAGTTSPETGSPP